MLKIRLMRIGTKKRPFYRVVAVDERSKRTGGYLELLGTYNPLTEPKEIKLKQDRIDHWIREGAQMSDGFLRIIGKAKERPPRKPKKAKEEKSSGEETPKVNEEEIPKSETDKAVGENLQSEEVETPEAAGADQTHSEVQETNIESVQTEPNGALQSDEASTKVEKETKDEGST